MKKIFYITLLLLAIGSSSAMAQGTLQFNQVLNLEISCCSPVSFTVPAGRVWKIESATYRSYAYPVRIYSINGNTTNGYICNYEYGGNNIYPVVLPFWVASGTSIAFSHGSSAGDKAYVSVIEFNIIP